MTSLNFASDNAGPMHPKVLEAVIKANEGYEMPYGNDTIMAKVRDQIRATFEAPDAAVYLVGTGTAANALALATYTDPWDAIFAHRVAHVEEDECGAPEFYAHGAKIVLVEGGSAKMDPKDLRAKILKAEDKDVHSIQRGPVTITQATEVGTLYALDEINAITTIAHEFGVKTHLDGARFANAITALDCSPAEMTWKACVDAVSFGGTKNGLLGVEACVIFDPELAWEFELRRKRGGHLLSKHRYLSAQMQAYLADGLWLKMAAAANARCVQLAEGLRQHDGAHMLYEPQANIIFFDMARSEHKRMLDGGAVYYVMNGDPELGDPDEQLMGRLVCDWSMTTDGVSQFLDLLRG